MNENWDDDVRADMSDALDGIVKEDKGALERVTSEEGGMLLVVVVVIRSWLTDCMGSRERNLQT